MRVVRVKVWNDQGVELDYRLFVANSMGVVYVSPINSGHVKLVTEYRSPICIVAYSFYEDELIWGSECFEDPGNAVEANIVTDTSVRLLDRWSNDLRIWLSKQCDNPPMYSINVETSERGVVLDFFVRDERLLQDLFAYILKLKGCLCRRRMYCIDGSPYCSDLDMVCKCNSVEMGVRNMVVEVKSMGMFGVRRVSRNQLRKVMARLLFFYAMRDLFKGFSDIYLAIPFTLPRDMDPGMPYIALVGTDAVVFDREAPIRKEDRRFLGCP